MNEISHIKQLFIELFNGEPWIDNTFKKTIFNIDNKTAMIKISDHSNTIWQITNHIIAWREHMLSFLTMEEPQFNEDAFNKNYFIELTNSSSGDWEITLKKLLNTQQRWLTYLDGLTDDDLNKIKRETPLFEFIHGIIHHDVYHLGQISFIYKIIETGKK